MVRKKGTCNDAECVDLWVVIRDLCAVVKGRTVQACQAAMLDLITASIAFIMLSDAADDVPYASD